MDSMRRAKSVEARELSDWDVSSGPYSVEKDSVDELTRKTGSE